MMTAATFLTQGAAPAQEDHVLALRDRGIFVVADGFGGPAAGTLASKIACDGIKGFLEKEAGDLEATLPFVLRKSFSLAGNVLFNALIHANRKMIAANRGKNVHEKGGASVVAGYLDGSLLAIASAGACSAWLAREGKLVELVTPRTYSRLEDPFSTDAGARAPLLALGLHEDFEPEIFEYRMRLGDVVIMATSGLRATHLAVVPSPESVENLVKTLKDGAYDSNAGAVIFTFHQDK